MSGSTGEYSILGFYIGPPYGWANTASLKPNILLYCPPTHAIIYTYFAYYITLSGVGGAQTFSWSGSKYIALKIC